MARIRFQLTREIIDQIIFGMENQEHQYFLDINTGSVVPDAAADPSLVKEGVLIPVPDWRPVDGFNMMEGFVGSLHNPVHREALRSVLNAGKGVFRNFKKTLKESEPLARKWYDYKEKSMRNIVAEWYNTNSEILKYQDLPENTDETDGLILEDFVFSFGKPEWTVLAAEKAVLSVRESFGEEGDLLADYYMESIGPVLPADENSLFIAAETSYGDFAGFLYSRKAFPGESGKMLFEVSLLWVEPRFRGLGIARHLMELVLNAAERRGASLVLFSLPGKASVIVPSLEALGAASCHSSLFLEI